MSESKQIKEEATAKTVSISPEATVVSARRRWLKRGVGVAPVVLTLASRPVLAWHCKSPSAWGSEVINPNTSLKNNAGHASYIDETWYISNWKNNTPRTGYGLDYDGVTGKPWSELTSVCTGLANDASLQTTKNGKKIFDYNKVTVGHLVTHVGGFVNPGFAATALVKNLSSNDSKTSIVFAQLNYVVLKQVKFSNGIDDCLKAGQLGQMASGTYMENGRAWTPEKIKEYLFNNYIARP